jgi:hypothetical protein
MLKNQELEKLVGKTLRFKTSSHLEIYDKNKTFMQTTIPVAKGEFCTCLKYTLTEKKSPLKLDKERNTLKTIRLFVMMPGDNWILVLGFTFQKLVFGIKQENFVFPEKEILKIVEVFEQQ